MKKVLVFFNSQQVEVINVLKPVTSIIRNYPNGDEVSLKVMLTEIHSLTGDHIDIFVASDRELNKEEVISAVNKYL
ncbi:hypothetical protein G7090_09075 [Leclercia sp. 29361]|jgi:hypothetical protein|uniref:hypothetical protein n=1 Tax=Leclercia TaxID=83654 RepID=UPI00140A0407|nr:MULTISPECIES: hypothetical protein [Leclercia]MCU6683848.1 hypothetical protein [Leclercia tamurae]MDY0920580.1 hypothetical protein [Leclercia sp. CFBP8987]QIK13520.1 hypothetical protein G7090_09075 [Leclercia sp. 29361]